MHSEKHNQLSKQQFENLFRTHFQHLVNFATQYVNEQSIAEDICQKIFLTLWEKRDTINPNQSIKSYLFTAVRNKCLNHIRDHKKFRSTVLDLDCGEIDLAEPTAVEADDALSLQVKHALEQLPQKCRQVFELSKFQNLKYKEIAEELDISVKTVEAHMGKALKTLRTLLKNYSIKMITGLGVLKIIESLLRVF